MAERACEAASFVGDTSVAGDAMGAEGAAGVVKISTSEAGRALVLRRNAVMGHARIVEICTRASAVRWAGHKRKGKPRRKLGS